MARMESKKVLLLSGLFAPTANERLKILSHWKLQSTVHCDSRSNATREKMWLSPSERLFYGKKWCKEKNTRKERKEKKKAGQGEKKLLLLPFFYFGWLHNPGQYFFL